jgi:ABC-type polysaccharide/polyol phosphate export permease
MKLYIKKIKRIFGLSFSLAKSNFKLRNEGSYLGIFWYLLEPLSFFIIILIMSGAIYEKKVEQYPIYLFLGLIMFNFFMAVTSASCKAMQENSNIIKSMKVDKEIFVIIPLIQFIFSHFFEMLILLAMMVFYKINIVYFSLYFIVFFFFCILCLAFNFILSAIGVFIKDLENVWRIFGRLLWLATPIFYYARPGTAIHWFNSLNPLYHFISIAREFIIFGRITSIKSIMVAFVTSLVILIIGIIIFEKNKDKFAENI